MISAPGLRLILTAALAVLAVYALWRAVRAPRLAGGVSHLLHAAMAVAMAVMCWPQGMDVPAVPQAVFFVAAALWFPVAAVAGGPGGTGRSRAQKVLAALPHTAVMAGMAWMLHAMDESMGASPHASGAAGHGASGGHHAAAPADLAAMSLHGSGQQTVSWILAAAFVALCLWWLARGFDAARSPAPVSARPAASSSAQQVPGDLLCHGVMALVMAVMFVLVA
ncbi:hypothetical protein DB35_25290 [Streptomyces abyssalis]|uniref:DUF5134 domain-containing protein n=1 Tax=Streptomyces abyssalis TaxID=933944 RepID=A0A1E7JN54_9ACTN|nr:DUF5134 domain-containing protein [Streptomyces abyssalis]OEU86906.1 hypothetical protein DB35_25290 [Streptomyces abyssalis]OEU89709.1 hypothetical protein AN215_08275 [Streptomyces abyssalis]